MCPLLSHPDGSVLVEEKGGKRAITIKPRKGLFAPTKEWVTSYSTDLIDHVLRVKGPAYLCDEIRRDEDPRYVQHHLRWDILSYVESEDFDGRRVLDFGSGSGASSVILARMFPSSEIVGVELVSRFVELARHRAKYHGVEGRVSFRLSPNPNQLPDGIGSFDYIVFSAVYEHLLPGERQTVLSLLWNHLKPGGVIFLNQTPYRWFPVEMHTTGLPLVNYLPDTLALNCARWFSRRIESDASWPDLLRRGIRGGTAGQILETLNREQHGAELLEPTRNGVRDDIDLWYKLSSTVRMPVIKMLMMWGFRIMKTFTGVTMVPELSLAIRKTL